ncbi:exonuclease V subunit gamma, partial [Escherichia coli]|nr:exonuclease V subunit gamma [Escherichia coli]
HSRMPFDPVNYVPDELQSYAREWLPAAKKAGTPQTDFIQTLEPRVIDTLSFEQLQRFWAHPVRAFFQQRLQVNFRSEESEIPDAEPFILDGLERFKLNSQLLNALVDEEDASKLFRRYRASGLLPY